MFPDFLDFHVDEMHLEMASREFAEIRCIRQLQDDEVAISAIDVKSYYIETPGDVAERVRRCFATCAAGTDWRCA
jgi:5-methyltetrahydropteroyltriglutamate--homocysteine methyltransferase